MVKSLAKFIILHIKIGYGWRLILVDAVITCFLLIEVIRYWSFELRLNTAFRLLPQISSYNLLLNLAVFLTVGLFIIPATIAFMLILTGSALRINRKKTHVKIIHIIVLIFLTLYLSLSSAMQIASGYMLQGESKSYAFTSYIQNFSSYSALSVALLLLLGFLARPILGWVAEKKRPALLQDYTARLYLADLGGDFYPKFARSKINFNSGAVAPEIRFVKRYAAGLVKHYQELIPGSEDSSDYLEQLLSECEIKLKGSILKLPPDKQHRLDFFPSTSRAMEIALLKVPGPKKIILSPYEHPVEDKVGNWISHIDGSIIKRIKFNHEDYQLGWDSQLEKIVSDFLFEISEGNPPFVIVISEVCYATGLHIPIAQLLQRLFEKVNRHDIVVIVDGAHAVGNVPLAMDIDFDFYVFSAHKWLFAPDPCGILLSAKGTPDSQRPYDCSSARSISVSTASVRNIAGLRASLELIDRISLEKMWERSKLLQKHLVTKLGERFEVVGSETELDRSNMLAIRPRAGLQWDYNSQGLAGNLRYDKKINLAVITLEDNNTWIRITLPYFMEFHQLNKLCNALDAILRK